MSCDGRVELVAGVVGGLRAARRQLGDARQPFLQLIVEAAVRVARLQLQEAQHQRAAEAQQRGREGRAHAAQRRGEAVLQLVEHGDAVGGPGCRGS